MSLGLCIGSDMRLGMALGMGLHVRAGTKHGFSQMTRRMRPA